MNRGKGSVDGRGGSVPIRRRSAGEMDAYAAGQLAALRLVKEDGLERAEQIIHSAQALIREARDAAVRLEGVVTDTEREVVACALAVYSGRRQPTDRDRAQACVAIQAMRGRR